tara:strand:+ start:926 stop:1867 length:942 start_codon:yes stop_codon:yes gene_type:complete
MMSQENQVTKTILMVFGLKGSQPQTEAEDFKPFDLSHKELTASKNYNSGNQGNLDNSFSARQKDKKLVSMLQEVNALFADNPKYQAIAAAEFGSLETDIDSMSQQAAKFGVPTIHISDNGADGTYSAEFQGALEMARNIAEQDEERGEKTEFLVAGLWAGRAVRDFTNVLRDENIQTRILSDLIMDQASIKRFDEDEDLSRGVLNALSYMTNDHIFRVLQQDLSEEDFERARPFIHDRNARSKAEWAYRNDVLNKEHAKNSALISKIEDNGYRLSKGKSLELSSGKALEELKMRPARSATIIPVQFGGPSEEL